MDKYVIPLGIIKKDRQRYFFSGVDGFSAEFSKKELTALLALDGKTYPSAKKTAKKLINIKDKEFYKYFCNFKKLGLITKSKKTIRRFNKKFISHFHNLADGYISISSLAFCYTNLCSYNCSFCYKQRKIGKMDLEFLKKVVDDSYKMGCPSYQLLGGEISALKTAELKKLAKIFNKKDIDLKLITNSWNNGQNIKVLTLLPINSVQVSINDIKQFHDADRKKGSYDRAIKFVKQALKRKLDVSVNCVVSKQNIYHISKIIDDLFCLGVKKFKLSPLITLKNNKDCLKMNDFKLLYFIQQELTKKHPDIMISVPMDNTFRGKLLNCTGAFAEAHVTYNKELLFCPFFQEKYKVKINSDFFAAWNSPVFEKLRNPINSKKITANGLKLSKKWSCNQTQNIIFKHLDELNKKEQKTIFAFSPWTKNLISEYKNKNLFCFLVYSIKNNKLIGFALAEEPYFYPNTLQLLHIFIEKKFRRGRIGTEIITWLKTIAQLKGMGKLFVYVSDQNIIAQKFYESNNLKFETNLSRMKNGKENLRVYSYLTF